MANRLPLILLPPSEGKAAGGDGPPWHPGSMALALDDERVRVLGALARAMRGGEAARGALLGVKGSALAAATDANRGVREAPTLPAIRRYSGVLYEALDAPSLTAVQRRRLHGSVLIFSGLWGAVAPGDPIPDYKLKMGASLPGVGKLSMFWRASVSEAIASRARDRAIWNLLPGEHDAAWVPPAGVARYTVRFEERRPDGGLKAVSHWNKFLKGALVRFLLAHPDADPEALSRWQHPSGYALDRDRIDVEGDLTRLVFVQEPG